MTAAPTTPPAIRVTVMPADTSPYGSAFGGWIVSQMALAAGSLASRRSHGKAVVVAMDELRFTASVAVGEELSAYASVAKTGRTSLTIEVAAWTRERDGEGQRQAATGRFTFVALNDAGRPRPIE